MESNPPQIYVCETHHFVRGGIVGIGHLENFDCVVHDFDVVAPEPGWYNKVNHTMKFPDDFVQRIRGLIELTDFVFDSISELKLLKVNFIELEFHVR